MHRVPDTNIVFLHIPKTAGQSVRRALGIRSSTGAHDFRTKIDQKFINGDFIRFCVVRNPMDRFISAYLYNRAAVDLKPTGVRAVMRDRGALNDINDFVDLARTDAISLSRFDHFKRQMQYIRVVRPQIVLRQENLQNDIQIIARLAGRGHVDLPKRNSAADRTGEDAVNRQMRPENEAFIKRYYAADFRFLGYAA